MPVTERPREADPANEQRGWVRPKGEWWRNSAALGLVGWDGDASELRRVWERTRYPAGRFAEMVGQVTGREVSWCGRCAEFVETDDMTTVQDETVCQGCADDASWCEVCEESAWDVTEVRGDEGERARLMCDDCRDTYASQCYWCEEYATAMRETVDGESICWSCAEGNYYYCEVCDGYYNANGEHAHECQCEAPHLSFAFPRGGETMREDERVTVELPKGVISDVGMDAIARAIFYGMESVGYQSFRPIRVSFRPIRVLVDEVGPTWQTKRGNFTRRLSSAWHQKGWGKLPAEVISEVGNLARQHSSDSAEWHVEMSRELNRAASYFYHGGSCWWGGFEESRCCLKSWGGIGLRSFESEDADYDDPNGRAWVIPVSHDEEYRRLMPTHDATTAQGFVVFNGYGVLEGYTAARIVAHLTGMTYKRVDFDMGVSGTYTNGGSGYLVASEEVASATDSVRFGCGSHDLRDAATVERVK